MAHSKLRGDIRSPEPLLRGSESGRDTKKKSVSTVCDLCDKILYELILSRRMIPLFDSELFAFIGSADGELIVNCRKSRREAEAQIDTIKIALSVTCRFCDTSAEFKFRPSASIATQPPNRDQSLEACVGLEGDSRRAPTIHAL